MSYEKVYDFWFKELSGEDHFRKSDELDAQIGERFEVLLEQAKKGELHSWRDTPKGRLSEVILLDQFSRNIFRNSAKCFEADPLAVALAQIAVEQGDDESLTSEERMFLYMPFMHSESLLIHDDFAVPLFKSLGMEMTYDYEIKHRNIIEKFGRYPHRNEILGRTSTAEEVEFLTKPGSSF